VHYDGATWATEYTSADPLNDIFGLNGSNIWAVGLNDTVLYYDGANWTASATGFGFDLTGVFAYAVDDVYVQAFDSSGPVDMHRIYKWNGLVWTLVHSYASDTALGKIRGVTGNL
jgi:hypothetical protein